MTSLQPQPQGPISFLSGAALAAQQAACSQEQVPLSARSQSSSKLRGPAVVPVHPNLRGAGVAGGSAWLDASSPSTPRNLRRRPSLNGSSSRFQQVVSTREVSASCAMAPFTLSLEDRVTKLENTLDEKVVSESLVLAKATEERLRQQQDEMRTHFSQMLKDSNEQMSVLLQDMHAKLDQKVQSVVGHEIESFSARLGAKCVAPFFAQGVRFAQCGTSSQEVLPYGIDGSGAKCYADGVEEQAILKPIAEGDAGMPDLRAHIKKEVVETWGDQMGSLQEELRHTIHTSLKMADYLAKAVDMENMQHLVKETLKVSNILARELALNPKEHRKQSGIEFTCGDDSSETTHEPHHELQLIHEAGSTTSCNSERPGSASDWNREMASLRSRLAELTEQADLNSGRLSALDCRLHRIPDSAR